MPTMVPLCVTLQPWPGPPLQLHMPTALPAALPPPHTSTHAVSPLGSLQGVMYPVLACVQPPERASPVPVLPVDPPEYPVVSSAMAGPATSPSGTATASTRRTSGRAPRVRIRRMTGDEFPRPLMPLLAPWWKGRPRDAELRGSARTGAREPTARS